MPEGPCMAEGQVAGYGLSRAEPTAGRPLEEARKRCGEPICLAELRVSPHIPLGNSPTNPGADEVGFEAWRGPPARPASHRL